MLRRLAVLAVDCLGIAGAAHASVFVVNGANRLPDAETEIAAVQ